MTDIPGNVAITMAGLGSRFTRAGYHQPKYEIQVLGRPLFGWSMDALTAFKNDGWQFNFATRRNVNAREFLERQCDSLAITKGETVEIDGVTDGQATTALLLAERVDPSKPFLIFNIDTYVRPNSMHPGQIPLGAAGWVPCFPGPGDGWSFARIDERGGATEFREKKRISAHATVGLYWFSSAALYISLYREFFAEGGVEVGERYVAPMYNRMIENGDLVHVSLLALDDVGMLGTPDQVAAFRPSLTTPEDKKMLP